MAWLETHPTSGRFKICFRWSGTKLKRTLKTEQRGQAEAKWRRLVYLLRHFGWRALEHP